MAELNPRRPQHSSNSWGCMSKYTKEESLWRQPYIFCLCIEATFPTMSSWGYFVKWIVQLLPLPPGIFCLVIPHYDGAPVFLSCLCPWMSDTMAEPEAKASGGQVGLLQPPPLSSSCWQGLLHLQGQRGQQLLQCDREVETSSTGYPSANTYSLSSCIS